jgi:hypothetical protein
MWEEGVTASNAATAFEEGKVVKRVVTEFPPRLKGTWKVDGSGPVADWFSDTYRVRHRVVHGGFEASRAEAQSAFDATRGVERFLFQRLALARNRYPRSALMTLAEAGLSKRGMWKGKIKRFHEEVAPTEDNWANLVQRLPPGALDCRARRDHFWPTVGRNGGAKFWPRRRHPGGTSGSSADPIWESISRSALVPGMSAPTVALAAPPTRDQRRSTRGRRATRWFVPVCVARDLIDSRDRYQRLCVSARAADLRAGFAPTPGS